MSKLEQIESQISSLSAEELARFRAWFVEFDAEAWDHQIERDLAAGKFDDLIAEAEEDLRAGRARPLGGSFRGSGSKILQPPQDIH